MVERTFIRVQAPAMTMRIEVSNGRCLKEARGLLMRMSLSGIDSKDIGIALDAGAFRWEYGAPPIGGWIPLSRL
jgi:hypothetical protein